MRQLKREVKIGNVTIGGKNPVAVQTMLNVPVEDIEGNVAQAKRCEAAGCQILRVTCPSPADAKGIEAVKNAVNIPIVADIHFDYKAALACADVGVDKIRINPGNIGDDDRVKAVVDACQRKNIPIRIGVNGGSLEKHILAKYGAPTPEAMVESALSHVRLLEKFDFNNIVISIKNSNVPRMMEAYRQLSAVTDYPLHVGVTEAGTPSAKEKKRLSCENLFFLLLFHFRVKDQRSQISKDQCGRYPHSTCFKTSHKNTDKSIFIYRFFYPFPQNISKTKQRHTCSCFREILKGLIQSGKSKNHASAYQTYHDSARHQFCPVQ